MSEVKKVIVHMGFHKTGTTSLQAYLQQYRKELKPYADIYMKERLGELSSAGRLYGQLPILGRRLMFRRALRSFLSSIPGAQTIVISRESFVGIMPGHRRFGLFPAKAMNPVSTVLAKELARGLRKRFGSNTEIVLLYTTREKISWLKSVWGHVVRSINLTQDQDEFVAHLKSIPSLEDEVAKIAKAVPSVTVASRPLEELKLLPAGPASSVLELLEVPEDFANQHPLKTINNVGETHEMQLKFLEMNRTIKNHEELKLAKAKIADELRKERGFKPVFEKRMKP